ncbi:hypothetical protein [Streptomyces boluensis]|uniref:Uncharacterized protein n=1 Tax=Streptomyces boluensis TaxID=1775135 RepID=A0A964UPI6_9ACTN|nr:hypothetical protein [Streptomyces boluensis]NBE51980.1 hypothetical protein [Streptomyces boluensis]
MTNPPLMSADWLPVLEPELKPTGVWWDVIRVGEDTGRMVLELLKDHGHRAAPAILDPQGRDPRMYLLVPLGAARTWNRNGTVALGERAHVMVPPYNHTVGSTLHWHAQPQHPRLFISPQHIAAALRHLVNVEADGAEL